MNSASFNHPGADNHRIRVSRGRLAIPIILRFTEAYRHILSLDEVEIYSLHNNRSLLAVPNIVVTFEQYIDGIRWTVALLIFQQDVRSQTPRISLDLHYHRTFHQ
ncbi:hypothetical protein TNCV_3289111 [Trichonephila clavipes]|nr:hypothetical protein TNCV_3289111 [Trichonephila clavipes]